MTGRKAVAFLAAAMVLAIAPASASAKRGYIYDMTKATGFERITFTGDMAANCLQFNTCGYNGTVTYTIGGKPSGKLQLTKSPRGVVNGTASYKSKAQTVATVTPPTGADCTDTVPRKADHFTLTSSGSKHQSLLLAYHATFREDALATKCQGPTEADADNANALPEGIFKAKDFFHGQRPGFGLAGSTPFTAAGFSSIIKWKLSFKARQRPCSPDCKLPPGTP